MAGICQQSLNWSIKSKPIKFFGPFCKKRLFQNMNFQHVTRKLDTNDFNAII